MTDPGETDRVLAPEILSEIAAAVAEEVVGRLEAAFAERAQQAHDTDLIARATLSPGAMPDLDSGPLDAKEVAEHFDVTRDWVYRHQAELGAVRLGDGERPRLRFYPDRVRRHLDACSKGSRPVDPGSRSVKPNSRPRRPPRPVTEVELLPVRGSDDAD